MSSDEDYNDDEYDDDRQFTDDDSDDEDYGLGSAVYDEEFTLRPRQPRFCVLSEADILQRQKEAIRDVATVLSVGDSEAALLLRHFKWSVSQVNDEWFHNEERVRQAVGLLSLSERDPTPPSPRDAARSKDAPSYSSSQKTASQLKKQNQSVRAAEAAARSPRAAKAAEAEAEAEAEATCGICFECFPESELRPASCEQHLFCSSCWQGYISTAITDGPGCLNMRCPDPECGAAVKEAFVLSLAPEALRAKFKHYVLRSYVDDNRNARWCPAPGCEYAVEFFPDSSNYDVTCKCGHNFCWNCNEEAHRPVDCETVAKWILKNSAESENMNWILAHSKACPKCKRPIEKNLGCMHMTCTPPCKHEFCWLCLGGWSEHGEKTGGFYACNRYESARNKGMYDEAERRKEMAQNSLEKYTHYYERWAANEQSRAKAIESLKEMQSEKIEKLSKTQNQPTSQLKFVTDAWLQIVECRRVLKWTYAYGYYLPMEEQAKRQFFEYLQGEADSALENLHRLAEKELAKYVDSGGGEGGEPNLSFSDFKSRLAGLTSVTHTYFENLVRALENGLSDVEQPGAASSGPSSRQAQQQQNTTKKDKRGQAPGAGGAPSSVPSAASTGGGGCSSGSSTTTNRAGAAAGAMARFVSRGRAATSGGHSAGASRQGLGSAVGIGRMPPAASAIPSQAGASRRSPLRQREDTAAAGGPRAASPLRQQQEESYWSCAHCTYANRQSSTSCAMCNLPRGSAPR